MTDEQWNRLIEIVDGELFDPLPVAFLIDSPWLPNWAGMSIMDYYASEAMWFDANVKVVERFPGVTFLPGFWAEWGMCTEPSAFGAKCIWHEDEFPFADKIASSFDDVKSIKRPDPRTDGMPPFVLKRLQHLGPKIEEAGHAIRFAAARGPLNIAGFLAGIDDLMMAMRMEPESVHAALDLVTDFLVDWIQLQAETIPTIEGILILDDIVGFCGEPDFKEFVLPSLKRVFEAIDTKVRFFHNDAPGLVCAPSLEEIGVNLFNFSFEHPMALMKERVGETVTLLGNIPTRDVMARGTPDDVRKCVREILDSVEDKRRMVLSCGGGMPPDVPTENIEAFLEAAGLTD